MEAKIDLFDTVVAVILQQKLDHRTGLKWAKFSSDNVSVPLCTELINLDLQARQLDSVCCTVHKHASGCDRN